MQVLYRYLPTNLITDMSKSKRRYYGLIGIPIALENFKNQNSTNCTRKTHAGDESRTRLPNDPVHTHARVRCKHIVYLCIETTGKSKLENGHFGRAYRIIYDIYAYL